METNLPELLHGLNEVAEQNNLTCTHAHKLSVLSGKYQRAKWLGYMVKVS